ncbi:MAG: glycosyltransferase [Myxococcota bacterium]
MSPAADRWQRGLIEALRGRGIDVEVVSYTIVPAWPKGTLALRGAREDGSGVTVEQLGYHNLPGWRVMSLAGKRVLGGLKRRRRRARAPLAIVTYNAHPNVTLPAIALRGAVQAPWVCVIADLHENRVSPLAAAEWLALGRADLRVFLSAAMAEQFAKADDLHMEGGIEPPRTTGATRTGLVVYAGALTRGAGVELAIDSFGHVRGTGAQLAIYGKGDTQRIRALAARDPRIVVHGLVSGAELAEALKSASVLVNPRLPDLIENQRNFPSKLLEYISYAKPIVSTWTAGLTNDYRKVLHVADADPVAFGRMIDECLALDESSLSDSRERATKFAATRSWNAQADRLIAALAHTKSKG